MCDAQVVAHIGKQILSLLKLSFANEPCRPEFVLHDLFFLSFGVIIHFWVIFDLSKEVKELVKWNVTGIVLIKMRHNFKEFFSTLFDFQCNELAYKVFDLNGFIVTVYYVVEDLYHSDMLLLVDLFENITK